MKAECFALKLAVLNQDEAMFDYLWTDQSLCWNLSHFFIILQAMMKYNQKPPQVGGWEAGVKKLLSSPTSKIIFLTSVFKVDDFIDAVDLLRDQFAKCEALNPTLAAVSKKAMLKSPYLLYSFFYELSTNE
jgi:hypothetical protein